MLLRSMLYVPGNSVRMAIRAAALPIDAVIFDLEDAVPLAEKETARFLTKEFVRLIKRRGINTFVRINSLTTSLTQDDLEAVVTNDLDGVMLPKSECGDDILTLDALLSEIEKSLSLPQRSIKVIPLIESAKGIVNLHQIANASKRVIALAFGAGDYCRDLGIDVTKISIDEVEILYARAHIVNVSKAMKIQAVDTPFLGLLTDKERFLKEVRLAVMLGFNGKQCIHPSQIEPVNAAFTPHPSEVEQSKRLIQAFEDAKARGIGAISFEGRMIDCMSYKQAKEKLMFANLIEEKTKLGKERERHVSVFEVFKAFTLHEMPR
ncbi:MAG: CoA ester lyase [Nitrososphaerales archaeon]